MAQSPSKETALPRHEEFIGRIESEENYKQIMAGMNITYAEYRQHYKAMRQSHEAAA